MRRIFVLRLLPWLVCLSGCAAPEQPVDRLSLQQQVLDTERSFARTMAERDHAAFTFFLSAEAIFFDGEEPLRGRDEIAAARP